MKTSKTIAALIIVAALMLATGNARAAAITWGAATTISGDTDVSTNGTLVVAYNTGNTTPGSVTVPAVSGVPFTNSGGIGAGFDGGSSFGAAYGGSYAPYTGLSAEYKDLLQYALWGGAATLNLTLSGLTVGHQYEFQWWSEDSRQGRNGWLTIANDGNGNLQVLNMNVANSVLGAGVGYEGSTGQFGLGTFTADGTTQIISFVRDAGSGNNGALINAYQLRDLSIPEPATITLLGVGALLVLRRRHC